MDFSCRNENTNKERRSTQTPSPSQKQNWQLSKAINKKLPKRRPPPTRSARVGKADPVRDLGILFGIFLLFYFVSNSFDNILDTDDGEMVEELQDQKKFKGFKAMQQALGSLMEEQMSKYPLREDCELFLAPSSIPKSGWGVFTGRDFTAGENVLVSAYVRQ